MSDHEFERKVQKKMDELRIRPSDAVWTEVQRNIRQNKRRRHFGFWLSALVVVLLMSGYIFYTLNEPASLPIAQSKTGAGSNSSTTNKTVLTENNATQQKQNIQHSTNATQQSPNAIQPSQNGVQQSPNAIQPSQNGVQQSPNAIHSSQNGVQQSPNAIHSSQNSIQQSPNATQSSQNGIQQSPNATQPLKNGIQQLPNATRPSQNGIQQSPNATQPLKNGIQQLPNATRPSQNGIQRSPNVSQLSKNSIQQLPNASQPLANTTRQLPNSPLQINEAATQPINNNTPVQNKKPIQKNTIASTQNNRQPPDQPSLNGTNDTEPSVAFTKPAARQTGNLPASMPETVSTGNDSIATGKAAPSFANQPVIIFAPEKQNSTVAIPVPIKKQQGPQWQWGLQANAGFSRISQSSLFDLSGLLGRSAEKNRAEDLAQRNVTQASFQGATNFITVAPPVVKKAAPIEPDLAYSAGVYVQRPLSKRLRLTVGLQYSFMSAHTTIGERVNKNEIVNQGTASARVVGEYYRTAPEKDTLQSQLNVSYTVPRDTSGSQRYTYRFHAIELPVMINWQINKGRQLPPFVLDGGFSLAHMWSVDALHFDGLKGIYYKDDALFNKTQFNAILGLNVGLFQQSKLPVWIGPSLRYSLTGLVKKDVSNGQFLWSTGINLRIQLNRL